mmetsp:Transcript_81524/g.209928  ORF Transcript_81524/g.209928 Transcript_81524/m.209928 type:complete len:223 (+) Transcript_81524:243-911(+)
MVLILKRGQVLHHRLRELALEDAPVVVPALGSSFLGRDALCERIELQEVGRLGSLGVAELQPHDHVRLGALDLLLDLGRGVRDDNAAVCIRSGLGHLVGAVVQGHDAGATRLADQRLRYAEDVPLLVCGLLVVPVHTLGDVARQVQVLHLVLTHRNLVCLVEKDVGGHEHGIGEEAEAHSPPLLHRLFLVLRHLLEPGHRRLRVQQPGELRMLRHGRLHEDC